MNAIVPIFGDKINGGYLVFMIYYLQENKEESCNAGSKARNDVDSILSKSYTPAKLYSSKKKNALQRIMSVFRFTRKFKKDDVLIVQYPMWIGYNKLLPFICSRVKTIVVIHDLIDLRDGKKDGTEHDFYKKAYKIISHNDSMTNYIVSKGIQQNRIINLELFDYMFDSLNEINANKNAICYAGSLDKAGFLREFSNELNNVSINVYGVGYSEKLSSEKVKYCGSYPSDVIHAKLDGVFGLIWDGNETTSCSGMRGEYLKFNNPHKASMYIAAGMPLIVWEESALADFVINNNLGFAVSDLKDVETTISKISDEEYKILVDNVQKIQKNIGSGYYLSSALKRALDTI